MLSFEAARAKVIETLRARASTTSSRPAESLDISSHPAAALGRVTSEIIAADREYPPFDRAMRDGFAVRSAEVQSPGSRLRLIGESRAGFPFSGDVAPGTCVQIMTGAPVPAGADSVVMIEHTSAAGDFIVFDRPVPLGKNVVRAGAENHAGDAVIRPGTRLGYAELAQAAQVGRARISVTPRPRVAVVSTGDEIVPVAESPGPYQIRNSNCISLAAQSSLAGAEPILLGNAVDDPAAIRSAFEKALASADLLVVSGGVSAGKYDLVEPVLKDLSAEFLFDAVAIRPGRPIVFALCQGKPVFGLPGNPVSTMVTFELFVRPAIEILSGLAPHPLPVLRARLRHAIDLKPALTHFMGARLSWPEGEPWAEVLPAESSGDIGRLTRGNCFLVIHESNRNLAPGDWVDVLPRQGAL